jgi:hypothetical protein
MQKKLPGLEHKEGGLANAANIETPLWPKPPAT